MQSRVQGSGFRIQGSGFRVQGLGLSVDGEGRTVGTGMAVRGGLGGTSAKTSWKPLPFVCPKSLVLEQTASDHPQAQTPGYIGGM